jgi:uncharacterized membrane protein YphA (DoxX/SURF4 family)
MPAGAPAWLGATVFFARPYLQTSAASRATPRFRFMLDAGRAHRAASTERLAMTLFIFAGGAPRPIAGLLRSPTLFLLARIGLTSAYWIGGLSKLLDWNGALAEAAHFNLHPPALVAAATIAVELGCSAMIIARRATWLACGVLAGFTVLATLVAHAFWTMQGQERFMAMNSFFEHLGLVCAFVLLAVLCEAPPARAVLRNS